MVEEKFDHDTNALTIGIDLGTTNSCICIYKEGKVQILENPSGERTTPTFIYFQPEGGVVIGKHAQKMAVNLPGNGIYEIKRLIGRDYTDPHVQGTMQHLSYRVFKNERNIPIVTLKQKGGMVRKTPQDLYTAFLKELKKYADEKLGQTVNRAVITVPAYFNVLQREITLAAAKDAGFKVLKLLNEPTAAALAYYYENTNKELQRCVVYDLGGGTFDISVLQRNEEKIQVLCVDGDTQLGGHDFDKIILEYVSQHLKEEYNYCVASLDDKRTLRNKCEEAKKRLSVVEEAEIVLNGMVPTNNKVKIPIKRQLFDARADKLFKKTIQILDNCLQNSNIVKESIHEVILCGGSTRIPRIQQLVSEYFGGKKLSKFVNPDECVAEGAAMKAANLSANKKQQIKVIEIVDVVPYSLGFAGYSNEMHVLIPRNTSIPSRAVKMFYNTENNQETMTFRIYEGERADVRKNRLLGTFTMTHLTPAPPQQLVVFATLSIDDNGILTAKAEERFGKNMKEIELKYNRGDLNEQNVDDCVGEIDEKFRNFVRLKCYLVDYCNAVMYNMEEQILTKKFKKVYDICKAIKETAEKLEMHREDGVKTMIEKCKGYCESIIEENHFKYMPTFSVLNDN